MAETPEVMDGGVPSTSGVEVEVIPSPQIHEAPERGRQRAGSSRGVIALVSLTSAPRPPVTIHPI
jgi:hypothetical protein